MKSKCCSAYAYCTEEVTEADDGEPYVEDFWICSECQKKCEITEVKPDDSLINNLNRGCYDYDQAEISEEDKKK